MWKKAWTHSATTDQFAVCCNSQCKADLPIVAEWPELDVLIKEPDREETPSFHLHVSQHWNENDEGSLKNNAHKIRVMIEI